MADEINDGGPAFARSMFHHREKFSCNHDNGSEGMSLRDYLAASALQGILAGQWNVEPDVEAPQPLHTNLSGVASNAYALADAMLKARQS